MSLMNFAFGGKRVEKNLGSLTPNYEGKSISAKAAPSLGNYIGYLHSFMKTPPPPLQPELSNVLHETANCVINS